MMYLRAGLLDHTQGDNHSVPGAIAADPDLDASQKQTLTQIYESFRQQNTHRNAENKEST